MKVEAYIQSIMVQKKISAYKLAKLSGLSQPGISYFLSGKRSPNLDTVKKICDALDISLVELFAQDMPFDQALNFDEIRLLNNYRQATDFAKKIAFFSLENGRQ